MKEIRFTTEKEYDGLICVNSCGKQDLSDRDYNTLRDEGRIDSCIQYVKKGVGYCEHEGKTFLIPDGSLVFYPPRVRHHYYFKKEDECELFWSHFAGTASFVEEIAPNAPVILAIRDRKQFESVFERLIVSYYNKSIIGSQRCDGYMLVLLSLLRESLKSPQSPVGASTALDKVLSDMHVYFNQPISIEKYADSCHLTVDSFIRTFRKQVGCPPYRYQLRIRIERAAEMLENTGLNVSEVAEVVGFSDHAYFSRIFKRFTGQSPSSYKK